MNDPQQPNDSKLPPLAAINTVDKWVHQQTRFHLPDTDGYSEMLAELALVFQDEILKAHMQGWHEGRAAANNPEIQYGYTSSINQPNTNKETTNGDYVKGAK